MNIKYLIIILSIIFFGCTEPETLYCPIGQIEDQCGICCDGSTNLECSDGPNKGAMDACGTCFGEIQNENECMGLCTDPEAGNYNQPMSSLECPCNYNSILIETQCCDDDNCENIIGPNENGICYILIDNPPLEIDLKFLIEDHFCQGEDNCNNFTNKECCEDITGPLSGCTDPHELNCEWIATFTTKSCKPVYFINTSNQNITIETTDTEDNLLWNNFEISVPANTTFNPEIDKFENICNQIDEEEGISCNDYTNIDDCNDNEHCHWYDSYSYILGNNSINGAFQYSYSSIQEYQFCTQGTFNCGTIIIE